MTPPGRAESVRLISMRYSGSVICCSRAEKSSGETTRRLEGIMAAFIWASRANPTTVRVVVLPALETVTVSPTSALLIAR